MQLIYIGLHKFCELRVHKLKLPDHYNLIYNHNLFPLDRHEAIPENPEIQGDFPNACTFGKCVSTVLGFS